MVSERERRRLGKITSRLLAQHAQAVKTFGKVKAQFILSELDLATTFCSIAASTNDPRRARRNAALAREAYDSALHFKSVGDTDVPRRTAVKIEERIVQVRERLEELEGTSQ